ncbi:MAG: iron donor protein CyaY [Planctomycetes bacterium]|nr:iron donor protein CyaY [Planctomycetota bacterium]MCB9918266.1 iron donor protein CyaY [Planctomycetota bacterium]
MDAQRFLGLSRACLAEVEDWLEGFDPDELDYTMTDGVVTLEFADGTRFVLNRQSGNHQMWFAAGVSAWHYDFDEASERWLDARDGHALQDRLAAAIGEKLGRDVAWLGTGA